MGFVKAYDNDLGRWIEWCCDEPGCNNVGLTPPAGYVVSELIARERMPHLCPLHDGSKRWVIENGVLKVRP